jgi:hypothetical protein
MPWRMIGMRWPRRILREGGANFIHQLLRFQFFSRNIKRIVEQRHCSSQQFS